MYTLTPQALQDISVRVVSKFMSKQASLSEGVASEASNLELNPEQIKRVIEASNSVAYLRQLQDAPDRTFEFPVADYNQVLGCIALPDGVEPGSTQPTTIGEVGGVVEKQAGGEGRDVNTFSFNEHEKLVLLSRELIKVASQVQSLEMDEIVLKERLLKHAYFFSKEPFALEKLAEVADEEDYAPLVKLARLEGVQKATKKVFKEADLGHAKELVHLYHKAKETSSKKTKATGHRKQAEEILTKAAGLTGAAKIVNRVGEEVGRGIGYGIGAPVGAAARAGANVVGGLGKNLMSKGSGSRTGLKVGASVAMAEPYRKEGPDMWETLHGSDY